MRITETTRNRRKWGPLVQCVAPDICCIRNKGMWILILAKIYLALKFDSWLLNSHLQGPGVSRPSPPGWITPILPHCTWHQLNLMKWNAFILLFPLRVFTVAPCLLVRSDVWACMQTCPWSDPPCEACLLPTSASSSHRPWGHHLPRRGWLLPPSPFTQIQISLPSRLPLFHEALLKQN